MGWNWRYEARGGDIDATDMTDTEFEQAVRESPNPNNPREQ